MSGEVAIVAVTYNSDAVLPRFLESIPAGVETIIVDNASGDGSAEIAERAGAGLVRLPRNLGYGAACNAGGSASSAPFLVVCNPDIRFEPDAIPALLRAAGKHPNAAFNPRFYSGRGRLFRRHSRLMPHLPRWHQTPPEQDCTIPVLSGACILIRRTHWEAVGGFDPAIFLFHEDDDLSLRLIKAGVELRLAADAVVHHSAGNSSIRSPANGRIKGEAMARSLVYVMRKHDLPLDIAAERRKTLGKLLLPHVLLNAARRAKHRGFLAGLGGRAGP